MVSLAEGYLADGQHTRADDLLTEELSGAQKIKMILDRRQDARRQRPDLTAAERRQAERRSAIDADPQNWGLAVEPSFAFASEYILVQAKGPFIAVPLPTSGGFVRLAVCAPLSWAAARTLSRYIPSVSVDGGVANPHARASRQRV